MPRIARLCLKDSSSGEQAVRAHRDPPEHRGGPPPAFRPEAALAKPSGDRDQRFFQQSQQVPDGCGQHTDGPPDQTEQKIGDDLRQEHDKTAERRAVSKESRHRADDGKHADPPAVAFIEQQDQRDRRNDTEQEIAREHGNTGQPPASGVGNGSVRSEEPGALQPPDRVGSGVDPEKDPDDPDRVVKRPQRRSEQEGGKVKDGDPRLRDVHRVSGSACPASRSGSVFRRARGRSRSAR